MKFVSILEPVLWLAGVLLMYLSIGAAAVTLIMAFRSRRAGWMLAGILIFLLTLGGQWRLAAGLGITGLILASCGSVVCSVLFYYVRIRPTMDWKDNKAGKEAARQTTLHLILLTGSFIFLVPFAWLVVSSLKEDKEMSQFPPVWIPTQQVKTRIDGQDAGLATTQYQGKPVTVAVMEEFETGDRRLQVVEPAALRGVSFHTNKDQLKEIRHVAPVWKNYPDSLKFLPPETHHGLIFLKNTLQVSILSILGTLLASSMVAYSFARLRWPGRDSMFLVLLATMMLPSAVTMMPVFMIFRSIGWIDSLKPLWVPAFFGTPFYIFLLRQFFLSIPTELEDAARIDGCSHYGIFWRIMLPQIKPALAALTIMAFMSAWNDFRGPLIYISSPDKETLAYALQLFQTAHGGEPGLLMAASTMMIIPVLALFFFTQRYFIEGITLTGIKG